MPYGGTRRHSGAMDSTSSPPDTGPRVSRDELRDLSRLRRPPAGVVGGVCAGIARHLDIDPLVVRVVVAALVPVGGAGLAVYLVGWLTIPEEVTGSSPASRLLRRDPDRVLLAGIVLAGTAVVLTLVGAVGFAAPEPGQILVLGLVAAVLLAVLSRRSMVEPSLDDGRAVTAAGPTGDSAAATDTAPSSGRLPRRLMPAALGLIALALGVIWVVDASGAAVDPSVYPGSVLLICAGGLLVATWYGRARLLIPLGLLAALATAATLVTGPGPFGERIYRPASAAAVQSEYRHGTGRLVVRLDEVGDVAALDGRTIAVSSRIGEVELVLPTSVDATVDVSVDGGQIHGIASAPDGGNDQYARLVPVDDADPDVTVTVDLRFGQVLVRRFDCPGDPTPTSGVSTDAWTGGSNAAACD